MENIFPRNGIFKVFKGISKVKLARKERLFQEPLTSARHTYLGLR
jgi:hypothetical protein